MGSNEVAIPPKSNKTSSPVQEPPANPQYLEWAAMQAYYGPGMMPLPYFSTAVASGHVPHPYMWGPLPLVPVFGSPYTALYPHGGVHSHPSVPLSSHKHCQRITPSPVASEAVVMATPLRVGIPAKSLRNKDKMLVKKLKGLDGLAASGRDRSTENRDQAEGNRLSLSGYNSTEGSSDGGDGDNAKGVTEKVNPAHMEETGTSSKAAACVTQQLMAKPVGIVSSSGPTPVMEIGISNASKVKAIGTPVPMDERELKRERRKQSNKESARRSRLRKQAETEELATRVKTLSTENMNLRSEISRLMENSDKLRLENSDLVEKLKNVQPSHLGKMKSARIQSVVAENLLMIENQSLISRTEHQEGDPSDQSSGKLHQQLLNSSP